MQRRNLLILFIGLGAIILSYYLVDKPVVYWAYAHQLRQYAILKLFTQLSEVLTAAVFIAYLWLLWRFYAGKRSYHDFAILIIANSVVITAFLVTVLKFIFARYWPATWIDDNLSLLSNQAYGFQWFKAGVAYESFPSGHIARMVAAMVALAIVYPRYVWLAVLLIALMVIGIVGMYYHFVSDGLAGGLLGYLVASVTAAWVLPQDEKE